MTTDPSLSEDAASSGPSLSRRFVLSAGASVVVSSAGLDCAAAPAGPVVTPMPALAQLSVPAGVLSTVQRQAMVTGVTRVLADASGLGQAGLPYVTVIVTDAAEGGWGVAGHGYGRAELFKLVAGRRLMPDPASGAR